MAGIIYANMMIQTVSHKPFDFFCTLWFIQ